MAAPVCQSTGEALRLTRSGLSTHVDRHWLIASAALPLRRDALHCPPHEWVGVEDCVEVLHTEAEQVAVGLCPHRGRPSRIGQKANLTKVGTITEGGRHIAVGHNNINNALLDEVHLVPNGALLDDDVTCPTGGAA